MFIINKKAIFLGLPRNGSSAVRENLLPYIDEEKLEEHGENITYEQAFEQYGRPALNRNFVFSFVRNPWDRMVSIYFNAVQNNPEVLESSKVRTFEAFCREAMQNKVGKLHDLCRTQVSLLKPRFKGNKIECIDYTGRFETLQRDYKTVCDAIGIEHKYLKLMNISRHFDYYNYFNDDLRKIASKFFEEDIDTFKYTFK